MLGVAVNLRLGCKMKHVELAWVQNVALRAGLGAKWNILRWLECKMEHFALA